MENGWSDRGQKASLNPKLSLFLLLSYSVLSSVSSGRASFGIILASLLFLFFLCSLGLPNDQP